MAPLPVAGAKRVARRLNAWICFADECGKTLRASKASTWAPRGQTPVATVTAAGSARVSVAGLLCYRPGHRSRLIYRTMTHRGRKNEPKGFRENDFAGLLDAAHQQLKAPIVLVWDRCAVWRLVISPAQLGGIWRNIPGSPG